MLCLHISAIRLLSKMLHSKTILYYDHESIRAHLSPVVFKHHEAGLWVSSARAGGGGTPARATSWTSRVQPAQPAHPDPVRGRSKITRTQR